MNDMTSTTNSKVSEMKPVPGVTRIPFGMLCTAPRGAGWAGERHSQFRRERGAVIAIKTPRFPHPTELRVQFRDGSAYWLPIEVVSFAPNYFQIA